VIKIHEQFPGEPPEVTESFQYAISIQEHWIQAFGCGRSSSLLVGWTPACVVEQQNWNLDNLYFSSDGIFSLSLSRHIKDLPLIKLINNSWLHTEHLDSLALAPRHRGFWKKCFILVRDRMNIPPQF